MSTAPRRNRRHRGSQTQLVPVLRALAALTAVAALPGCGESDGEEGAFGSGAGGASASAATATSTGPGGGAGGAAGPSCAVDADCVPASPCEETLCFDGACRAAPRVCPPPPEEPGWVDACLAGAPSFTTKALGGSCNGGCDPATGACVYSEVEVPCPEPATFSPGHLPVEQVYQVVLRNYLSSLAGKGAFDVPLGQLTWDETGLATPDLAFPVFALLRNRGYDTPSALGLRASAALFELPALEQPDGIHMAIGRYGFFEPLDTATWYAFSYPGNPHRGHPGVLHRTFTGLALDLALLDRHYDGGGGLSGQNAYQGPYLARHGLAYELVRSGLLAEPGGACVAAAYEVGLREMVDRFVTWDGSNGNTDMEAQGIVGLFAAARATSDLTLEKTARDETARMLGAEFGAFDDAGYYYHGDRGPDLSYNGVALHFILAAVQAGASARVSDVARRMLELKAHLTLPEPVTEEGFAPGVGNLVFSPNHFNTADGAMPTADQWAGQARDYGAIAVEPAARYLAWGGRNVPIYFGRDVPESEEALRASLDVSLVSGSYLGAHDPADGFAAIDTPYAGAPELWKTAAEDGRGYHWSNGIFASVLFPRKGTFDALLAFAGTEEQKAPFLRAGDLTRAFGESFFVAKRADSGFVVYAGEVGDTWAGGLAGFGGGCLSAFWTAGAGPALLGWTRGTQGGQPFDWPELDGWPVHATSGWKNGGVAFSTARVRALDAVSLDAATGTVTVTGTVADAASNGGLSAAIGYQRSFVATADGLTLSTTLSPTGAVSVDRLVEVFPFFEGTAGAHDAPVSFVMETAGGGEVAYSGAAVTEVTAVIATRRGHAVRLELDAPRTVNVVRSREAPPSAGYGSANVLVELLAAPGDVPAASYGFTLRRVD